MPDFKLIWNLFLYAVNALTKIPIPGRHGLSDDQLGMSALFHPLVGLGIGVILIILLSAVSALNAVMAAIIVLIGWILLTGLIHLPGFMATVQTMIEQKTKKSSSYQGPKDRRSKNFYSAIVICLLLLLKFAALSAALVNTEWSVILISCILARTVVMCLLSSTEYLEPHNYAEITGMNANRGYVIGSAALACIVAILFGGIWIIAVIAVCAILAFVALVLITQLQRGKDGIDGNSCHALVEVFEVITLWFTVLLAL